MEFRILGPLEARDNGRVLELGGAKQRAVLALLLLQANEVVALDRLIDGIWGERAPDTAATAVHGSVSRLRKVLEPDGAPYRVIRTQAPGYVFAASPDAVDRYRFERLAAEGKAALEDADATRAAELLREALALWRGPALADIALSIADRTEIDRLEEEWLSAVEDRLDADLALERHALLVPELEALVARHPLRERLRGQLMAALYGAGRQADALETYRQASRLLDDELGVVPGPALRELERRILLQDPALATPRLPARARARSTRARVAVACVGLALGVLGVATFAAMRGGEAPAVDRVSPNGVGAIDPASNTLVQSIPVGEYPEHLVVDEGSVWVANAGDHTVSRIDSDTGQVTTTKGLTGAPVSLSVRDGVVWIAMSHFDQPTSIVRLTGVPNESAEHVVELEKGPGLLLPVLTSGSNGLWASLFAEPDTFVLGADGTIRRLNVLPGECNPVGGGRAGTTVWIGCDDGRIVRVDEATRRRVATTRVGTFLSALVVGEGAVWLADSVENVVWRVDAATGGGRRARSPSASDRRASPSASGRCGSRVATAAPSRGSIPTRIVSSPPSAWGATSPRSRSATAGSGSLVKASRRRTRTFGATDDGAARSLDAVQRGKRPRPSWPLACLEHDRRCSPCARRAVRMARTVTSAAPPPILPLMTDAPLAEDEVRPVTILFADIVGSTGLGEKLAPDEVKALVGECVTMMSRAVEEYGGMVQAYAGDGICAYFGVPAAHDDDPERAARAGLRILEVVAEYARDVEAAWGLSDFAVRVGINTGQAAVGRVGAAEPGAVALGDATNVASRLQSLAEPGTIAVGDATARRLAHRFVFEPMGEFDVKGRQASVTASRLLGPRARGDEGELPLVGREGEMSQLLGALGDLVAGRGRVILLLGDPGMGKTRLLGELRSLAGDRVAWLEGHCLSYGGLDAWPFVEALLGWLGADIGEPEIALRTKARAKLTALLGSELGDLLPGLGRFLRLRIDGSADMSAERSREAYIRWLEALARQRPLVVALEDVHWADTTTRELAEAVLDLTERAPVALVVTEEVAAGSEGAAIRLRALGAHAHRTAQIALGPLSEAAAEQMLESILGAEIEAVTRKGLVLEAEGNPLYLAELARALLEGGLEPRGRTWTISVRADLLPPALENLLVARIDRLPPAARQLVTIAAAIGRTFPVAALEEVEGGDVGESLTALLRSEIVREVRRYPVFECSFTHGLLHDAALSTLTPGRKRELYARVASAFESLYAESLEEHLERLAHYHAQAGNLPKAFQYAERARAGPG